ncbi:hypothetical protein Hanom_Chr04g00377841 [Helianthus anomalus]
MAGLSSSASLDHEVDDGYEDSETEEGEVRSPAIVNQSPAAANRSSSDPTCNQVGEKPSEEEGVKSVEFLHEVHGESSFPKEAFNVPVGPEVEAAGDIGCGPEDNNISEKRNLDIMDQVGPTPIPGLRKRNRENRSPPSSGSMQGPPTRGFHHGSSSSDFSFDLNRPNADFVYTNGVELDGVNPGQNRVAPGRGVSDGRAEGPPEVGDGWFRRSG